MIFTNAYSSRKIVLNSQCLAIRLIKSASAHLSQKLWLRITEIAAISATVATRKKWRPAEWSASAVWIAIAVIQRKALRVWIPVVAVLNASAAKNAAAATRETI